MSHSVETVEETKDAKEQAYLYDLVIVPQWRERFDRIVDEAIQLPEKGKLLDAGCGTGGYAVDLALRGSARVSVLGVDPIAERLALARGKAEVKKCERVAFQQATLIALGVPDEEFDLVIGDLTMLPAEEAGEAVAELRRAAKPNASVAVKLATRGSFDEFFSVYWEALYNLGWVDYSPPLERLAAERLTISEAEELAVSAGLKSVRSVTRREELDFKDAAAFFESPLIATQFLGDWLAILPDPAMPPRLRQEIARIIDAEHDAMGFDVSVKATVVSGRT